MVSPDVIMRRMVEVVVCWLMSGLGNWATSESTAIQSTGFAGARQIITAVQKLRTLSGAEDSVEVGRRDIPRRDDIRRDHRMN
jgi:hypothetical protein